MDPLIKQVKWVTKIGHELTFLPTHRFSKITKAHVFSEHDMDSSYSDQYWDIVDICVSKMRQKTYASNIEHDSIHNDCGCIEISSRPLESWGSFVKWNSDVRNIAYENKMTHKLNWNAGGMGHHHMDQLNSAVTDRLFRVVAQHPYLAWMFVDPEDTKNCKTIAKWYLEYHRHEQEGYFVPCASGAYDYPSGRCVCLSFRDWYDTIEWRAFDSAEDMQMQIEHTAFLQALVGYAIKTATNKTSREYNMPMFKNAAAARRILKKYQDPDLCAKEFLEFIELIGLPKDRYERYIDMNLRPRLEMGNGF